jgi:hypothetical protein
MAAQDHKILVFHCIQYQISPARVIVVIPHTFSDASYQLREEACSVLELPAFPTSLAAANAVAYTTILKSMQPKNQLQRYTEL